jgi:hypothetical protein
MKYCTSFNAVLVPVKKHGKTFYFFLDSGFPFSFSKNSSLLSAISNTDIGIQEEFSLKLKPQPIDLTPLSQLLMIDIQGFLGLDFFNKFDNIKINFRTSELEFNVKKFTPDKTINISVGQCLTAEFLVAGKKTSCAIDTGSYQCFDVSHRLAGKGHLKSCGWKLPTPIGDVKYDFHSGIEIGVGNISLGKYVVSTTTSTLPLPFEFIAGLNLLSNYECLFDFKNGVLLFKDNPRVLSFPRDLTEDLYTIGIQLVLNQGNLTVHCVFKNCVIPGIKVGDKVELSDINFADPEMANVILKRLSSIGESVEIPITVNNKAIMAKTVPLFE